MMRKEETELMEKHKDALDQALSQALGRGVNITSLNSMAPAGNHSTRLLLTVEVPPEDRVLACRTRTWNRVKESRQALEAPQIVEE